LQRREELLTLGALHMFIGSTRLETGRREKAKKAFHREGARADVQPRPELERCTS
jgi:hypothetical protein